MSPFKNSRSTVVFVSLLELSCRSVRPNPDHCNNNDGDAYCRRLQPDGTQPYCEVGDEPCITPGRERYGCVAERPKDECYSPCGVGGTPVENGECTFGAETTATTTSDATAMTTSTEGTTGPMPCTVDEECAELDPTAPLCVDGTCVQCTPDDPIVCDEQRLLCDGESGSCMPCTEHGQCSSGACELANGRCFPQDFVAHVNGDELAMPPRVYASVVTAVNAVPDGAHGVIVVHERGETGDTPYTAAVTIDGGKTIALLAAPGESPIMRGAADRPGLRVQGDGASLYMDGFRISGDTGNLGIDVDGALAWVDRSWIVHSASGGILAQNGAELTLRTCFVGGGEESNALASQGATVDVLYSTLGADFGASVALWCDEASTVTVRNSLIVSLDNGPEVVCRELAASDTAAEDQLNGTGNVALGNMSSEMSMIWFQGYDSGDFHLMNPPLSVATTAQWKDGDPATDIDVVQPRPHVDGMPDVAGADIP